MTAPTDLEIADAVRTRLGLDAAVGRRRAWTLDPGASTAQHERVRLRAGGARIDAVLKVLSPGVEPSNERRFYEELAPRLRARVPRLLAAGPAGERYEGWLLLERFARGKPQHRWTSDDVGRVAAALARLHAATLEQPPDWLPRPFARDAAACFAHVEDGVRALRALGADAHGVASERAIEAALALARDPSPLLAAAARSPWSVVHRDCHRGNMELFADGPLIYDWEDVSAGPPIFDLTLLFQYLRVDWWIARWLERERSRYRDRWLEWDALLGGYLDALASEGVGPDRRSAIAGAADAAFAWECVYRIGKIALELRAGHELLRRAEQGRGASRWLARRSGISVMLRVWRVMFRDLERRAMLLA